MIKKISIEPTDPAVFLSADIVYGNRREFCRSQFIPLKVSIMKPRVYFHFDREITLPTIVFLCGGGWQDTDHNVWLPELCWFVKHGYAVASVQYPVTSTTRHPESLNDIIHALDFLQEHSEELNINTDKMVLMGESAGAYMALLCAAADKKERISSVTAFYPPIGPIQMVDPVTNEPLITLPNGAELFPSLLDSMPASMPPSLILHGTADEIVPLTHGEQIYQRLQELGVPSELIVVEGANHADSHFFQPKVKEMILDFIIRNK